MIKELVRDEKLLSQPCEAATAEDAPIADDLVETMQSLDAVACLAANQIGVTKCVVAYVDDNDQTHVMFNPVLKKALHPSKTVESCLSRDSETKITRFGRISVAYDELVDNTLVPRKREFVGWTAQIIQHMIDHCKGKLV